MCRTIIHGGVCGRSLVIAVLGFDTPLPLSSVGARAQGPWCVRHRGYSQHGLESTNHLGHMAGLIRLRPYPHHHTIACTFPRHPVVSKS